MTLAPRSVATLAACLLAGCADPHTGRLSTARTVERVTHPETVSVTVGASDTEGGAKPLHTALVSTTLVWRLEPRRYAAASADNDGDDGGLGDPGRRALLSRAARPPIFPVVPVAPPPTPAPR